MDERDVNFTIEKEESSGQPLLDRHELTPRQIVAELDKHIVGQEEAKRSVAVVVRNRYRRQQLDPRLQEEIIPKNYRRRENGDCTPSCEIGRCAFH